jgi:putative ferrous iron transport protein C
MILSELRDYLQTHQRAAISDMAHHFNTDPDALRGMLAKWVAKGKVVKPLAVSTCGGCCQCDPAATEIYEWKG